MRAIFLRDARVSHLGLLDNYHFGLCLEPKLEVISLHPRLPKNFETET